MSLLPVRAATPSRWLFKVLVVAGLMVAGRAFADEARVLILDPRFVARQIRWEEQTSPWWSPGLSGGPRLGVAPDGKIWVSGSLLVVQGLGRQIVRLNMDGSVDQSFEPGDSLGEVTGMAVDKEGNVFLGTWSAERGAAVVRLNNEGATVWACELDSPSLGPISGVVLRNDGKIAVSRNFTTSAGLERSAVALVNPAGTLDASFEVTLNGPVHCMEATPEGSLVIGGNFTDVGGVGRMRLARVGVGGTIDLNFDPGENLTAPVTAVHVTQDGLILVSGRFNKGNGAPRDRFVRLTRDGSVDEIFEAVALDEPAARIVIDEADRILLAGAFNRVNGQTRHRIARLHANGSLDAAYNPGEGPNSVVRDLVIDSTGNYVISGGFSKVGHRSAPGIARVFSNSSVRTIDFADEVFSTSEQYGATGIHLQRFGESDGELTAHIRLVPGTDAALAEFKPFETEVRFGAGETFKVLEIPLANDGVVESADFVPILCEVKSPGLAELQTWASICVLDDEIPVVLAGIFGPRYPQISPRTVSYANDRIAVGGWLGFGPSSFGNQPGLVVLREDGSLDPSFGIIPVGGSSDVRLEAVTWTADGKLLIGGSFSFIRDDARKNLARMNPDGTLDPTFVPNVPAVQKMLALADGKILVAPGITSPVMRLHADGGLDASFQAELPNGHASEMELQADGKILVSDRYRGGLTRLLPDGAIDSSFAKFPAFTGPFVNGLALALDGKILIAGPFSAIQNVGRPGLARLNEDGTLDLSFNPREYRPSSEYPVLFQRADGKILVGGERSVQCLNADGSVDDSLIVPPAWSLQPLVELASGEILAAAQAAIGPELINGLAILVRTNPGISRFVMEGAPIRIREGEALREMQIRRIGDISQRQTASISFLERGKENDELIVSTRELVFEPMQSAASLKIGARGDPFIENEERFRIEFSGPGAVTSAYDLFVVDANGRPGSATIYPGLKRNQNWLMMAPGGIDSILLGGFLSERLQRINSLTGKTEPVAVPETNEFSVRSIVNWENKILIGCTVRSSDRLAARLYRLQADGSPDPTFSSPNFYVQPWFILPQPDGKIAVAGDYVPTADNPGTFILLNTNGTVHRTFKRIHYVQNKPAIINGKLWQVVRTSEINGTVDRIHVHDLATDTEIGSPMEIEGYARGIVRDGESLLVYGDFDAVGEVRRSGLARLESGVPNKDFQPQILPPEVTDLIIDAQGRIVIIGAFAQVNGVDRRGMARLLRDGSLDVSFEPDNSLWIEQGYYLHSIAPLQNGNYATVFSATGTSVFGVMWIRGDLPFSGNLARGLENELMKLVFNTVPGKSYRIESSRDLSAWSPMLETNAPGFQVWFNSSAESDGRFYRAQQLP